MGATPLAGGFFLAGSDLYNGNTLVASGVTAVVGYPGGDSRDYADYIDASGVAHTVRDDGRNRQTWPLVPAWSTPVGAQFFLKGTSLHRYNRAASISTGNTGRTVGYFGPDGIAYVAHTWKEQNARLYTTDVGFVVKVDEAPGITAQGASFWLHEGNLYHAKTPKTVMTSNVAAVAGYAGADNAYEYASIVKTDGKAYNFREDGRLRARASVPLWATPLGGDYFLAGTDLYYGNTLTASSVAAAYGYSGSQTGDGSSSGNVDYVTFTQITAC